MPVYYEKSDDVLKVRFGGQRDGYVVNLGEVNTDVQAIILETLKRVKGCSHGLFTLKEICRLSGETTTICYQPVLSRPMSLINLGCCQELLEQKFIEFKHLKKLLGKKNVPFAMTSDKNVTIASARSDRRIIVASYYDNRVIKYHTVGEYLAMAALLYYRRKLVIFDHSMDEAVDYMESKYHDFCVADSIVTTAVEEIYGRY